MVRFQQIAQSKGNQGYPSMLIAFLRDESKEDSDGVQSVATSRWSKAVP